MAFMWNGRRWLPALIGLALTAWLSGMAAAADDEAALRKQVLALNEVTGEDPVRGEILTLLDNKDKARKLVAFAAKLLKEKDPPLTFNGAYILGQVAQRLKDNETSIALYRVCAEEGKKLKSGSKIGQAYGGLIAVYYGSGKFDESEKLCREFLEMRGDETLRRMKPVVLRQMIQALAKQGKVADANKLLDDLLKAQPDNWLTLELRGWVQREAGQYAEAAKTYEDVLDRIQKDKDLEKDEKTAFASEVRYLLSGVYVDANDVGKAAGHLQELMKEEPDNPSYSNDLGYIWADHDQNLDEAEKLIRKAIEDEKKDHQKQSPDTKPADFKPNPAYLDSLGWVLFKKKKFKEALSPLEDAVKETDGQHIEIFDHLAEVRMALGDKAGAVDAWKKGIEHVGTTKREQQKKVDVEKKLKAAAP